MKITKYCNHVNVILKLLATTSLLSTIKNEDLEDLVSR